MSYSPFLQPKNQVTDILHCMKRTFLTKNLVITKFLVTFVL